jgi:hypothetical protein
MGDSIWKPCEDVEEGIFVAREDVAEIGTIEDVFQGRENADVDGRTICTVNESRINSVLVLTLKDFWMQVRARVNVPAGEEQYDPAYNRQGWEPKLTCNGKHKRQHEHSCGKCLDHRSRSLHYAQAEYA